MMMADDKKKLAMIIVAKAKDPKKSSEDKAKEVPSITKEVEGDEKDAEPGLSAAAEEMIQAFEQKDAEALKSALKDFISMCEYEEPKSSEDESESV